MIYVFKYIYTWLLPPGLFVLLLLWLSWRLWRKARDQAWMALAISALLYLFSIQPGSEALLRYSRLALQIGQTRISSNRASIDFLQNCVEQ